MIMIIIDIFGCVEVAATGFPTRFLEFFFRIILTARIYND